MRNHLWFVTPSSYFSFYSPQQKLHLSFTCTIFVFCFCFVAVVCVGGELGVVLLILWWILALEHHTMDDAWNCVIPITVRFAVSQDNLTTNLTKYVFISCQFDLLPVGTPAFSLANASLCLRRSFSPITPSVLISKNCHNTHKIQTHSSTHHPNLFFVQGAHRLKF